MTEYSSSSPLIPLDLLADSDFAVAFVDVTPAQPEHFAAAQTVEQQQHKCGIQRMVLGSFDEGPGLGHPPWRDWLTFPGRQLGQARDVADNQLFSIARDNAEDKTVFIT